MHLKEMWECVDGIHLSQDVAGSCYHGNEHSGSIKGEDIID
jgi:hypothetical protein